MTDASVSLWLMCLCVSIFFSFFLKKTWFMVDDLDCVCKSLLIQLVSYHFSATTLILIGHVRQTSSYTNITVIMASFCVIASQCARVMWQKRSDPDRSTKYTTCFVMFHSPCSIYSSSFLSIWLVIVLSVSVTSQPIAGRVKSNACWDCVIFPVSIFFNQIRSLQECNVRFPVIGLHCLAAVWWQGYSKYRPGWRCMIKGVSLRAWILIILPHSFISLC